MRKLQRFCAAVVLTLALTLSAAAGEMSCPGITSTGEMPGPGATATGEMSAPGVAALDPVTEAALSLLQGLLSLF